MVGEKMKYLLVFFVISAISCEKSPDISSTSFFMDCKKLAERLKIDFIVEGTESDLRCLIGQKDDVFGGLSGYFFNGEKELKGADKMLSLKESIPYHTKRQQCAKKCKHLANGGGHFIGCKLECLKKLGIK
jgi:hypothetical protein